MVTETWIDALRNGRAADALEHIRRAERSPANFYTLGAVYMWAGNYRLAHDHFGGRIQRSTPANRPADLDFGMAGSAAWCLGDDKLTLKYWRKGVTAGPAVGGANTRTALLLYAASVLTPSLLSTPDAEKILAQRMGQQRGPNWPGPIAQYLLGSATEEAIRTKTPYRERDPISPNPRSWQIDFYKLLKDSASGSLSAPALRIAIQSLVQVESSVYLDGQNFFYFLRQEEFYIARHWLLNPPPIPLAL